jgi:hypothetical protein
MEEGYRYSLTWPALGKPRGKYAPSTLSAILPAYLIPYLRRFTAGQDVLLHCGHREIGKLSTTHHRVKEGRCQYRGVYARGESHRKHCAVHSRHHITHVHGGIHPAAARMAYLARACPCGRVSPASPEGFDTG